MSGPGDNPVLILHQHITVLSAIQLLAGGERISRGIVVRTRSTKRKARIAASLSSIVSPLDKLGVTQCYAQRDTGLAVATGTTRASAASAHSAAFAWFARRAERFRFAV